MRWRVEMEVFFSILYVSFHLISYCARGIYGIWSMNRKEDNLFIFQYSEFGLYRDSIQRDFRPSERIKKGISKGFQER